MREQPCKQNSKRCSKIHGNGKRKGMASNGDVSTQVSFFKIMIGDFEEAMFIPPQIAQSFWHLCNKDTCLEDSEGHSQKVAVSVVDGSLAFQQGWRDFVLDHSIRDGELVVFKYTSNSFSVQIFAKSACERLHFSGTSNGNKRRRKKVNIDTSPILLHFEENSKSSEPLKDKSLVTDEDLVKEGMAIEPIPELYGINTETSPNLLPFEENNKSSETSKDKLCATDGVPVMEAMAIEPTPELYGIQMTPRIFFPDGVEEGLAILNSLELPIESPMKYSEAPCNMNSDAVEIEECGKVPLVNLCDDDMEIEVQTRSLEECGIDGKENLVVSEGLIGKYPLTNNHMTSMVDHLEPESTVFEQDETHIASILLRDPGTIERQCFPEDKSTLLLDVEKLLQQHKGFQTKPMVECNEDEIVNQSETNWALFPCPSTEQGLSSPSRVDCSQGKNISDSGSLREQGEEKFNASDKQMIDRKPDIEDNFDTSSSSFTDVNFITDETETVFASNSVVQEFLTSKEQTCCNIDEDLKCKSDWNRNAPIGMPYTEKEDSPCPSNEAVIARNKSYVCDYSIDVINGIATINVIKDVKRNSKPSFQPINDNQIKNQFGDIPAFVSGVANASKLGVPDPSELPKYSERNSSQTGIMPEDSPYVNSNVNAKEIAFVSPRVVRELISEEDTCCILNKDLSDNVEAHRDALLSLYPIEREESARPCNEAVVAKHNSFTFEHRLEAPSGRATTNCTKYFRRNAISSSEMIAETLIKEQLGVPAPGSRVVSVCGLDTVGSNTLTNADPSEFRKDLERKPFQTGNNPDLLVFSEDEMEFCCNMDGGSTGKFKEDKDTPIGICIAREGPSNEAARYKSYVYEDSLKVSFDAAPTKCTEDVKVNAMPSSEPTKYIKTKGLLGDVAFSGTGLVNTSGLVALGSDTLNPPDTSELPEDSERNCFMAGITPVDSPDVYCNEDKKKLFTSNMVVPEFPISKKEACCNMDEDLSEELEADSNAPISMCHTEGEDSARPSDEAAVERKKSCVCEGIFEEPSSAVSTNYTKDLKGNEMPKDSPDMGCNADKKNSLFGSNMLVRESLVSEKETCCNMDEDVVGELEADRDPPIRTYHIVRRHSANSSRKAVRESNKSHVCEGILEVPSCSATTYCTKDAKGNDMPPSRPIKDTHVIEQLGCVPVSGSGLLNATTSLDTVESNTSITPDASKFSKDSERNSFPIGIMPKGSPKVDAKKVVSSVKGKPSVVVKTERMDSEDHPSSNNATSKFAFSISVNGKSWLELPKRLPACLRKRNADRTVVILQDLKMRTWPVLYQENSKFVGFIGGWKELMTANNLRKGHVCHFEHIEGPEPTYQMRRRPRANISNMKP